MLNLFRPKLSRQELANLRELTRLEGTFQYAAAVAKGNTAIIPKGKVFASQLEALAQIMSERKQAFISGILARKGIPAAQVNMTTGIIKQVPTPNVPASHREASKK